MGKIYTYAHPQRDEEALEILAEIFYKELSSNLYVIQKDRYNQMNVGNFVNAEAVALMLNKGVKVGVEGVSGLFSNFPMAVYRSAERS